VTGALVMHALRHPSPRAHLSPGSERITRIKRPTFPYSNLTRIRWLSGAKIRHRDGLQTTYRNAYSRNSDTSSLPRQCVNVGSSGSSHP
jgi:hypothetical protein